MSLKSRLRVDRFVNLTRTKESAVRRIKESKIKNGKDTDTHSHKHSLNYALSFRFGVTTASLSTSKAIYCLHHRQQQQQ